MLSAEERVKVEPWLRAAGPSLFSPPSLIDEAGSLSVNAKSTKEGTSAEQRRCE